MASKRQCNCFPHLQRCPPDAEAGGPARPCSHSTQEGAAAARRRERRERIRDVHCWQCSLSLRGAGRARPKVRSLRFGGLARFGLVGVAYPLHPPAARHARANAHASPPQFLRAGTIELRSAGRGQSYTYNGSVSVHALEGRCVRRRRKSGRESQPHAHTRRLPLYDRVAQAPRGHHAHSQNR